MVLTLCLLSCLCLHFFHDNFMEHSREFDSHLEWMSAIFISFLYHLLFFNYEFSFSYRKKNTAIQHLLKTIYKKTTVYIFSNKSGYFYITVNFFNSLNSHKVRCKKNSDTLQISLVPLCALPLHLQ